MAEHAGRHNDPYVQGCMLCLIEATDRGIAAWSERERRRLTRIFYLQIAALLAVTMSLSFAAPYIATAVMQ